MAPEGATERRGRVDYAARSISNWPPDHTVIGVSTCWRFLPLALCSSHHQSSPSLSWRIATHTGHCDASYAAGMPTISVGHVAFAITRFGSALLDGRA